MSVIYGYESIFLFVRLRTENLTRFVNSFFRDFAGKAVLSFQKIFLFAGGDEFDEENGYLDSFENLHP